MIEVLEAGPLTSVQDVAGRPRWRYVGVPVGGTADAWSARLANRLVGNPEGAPVLEVTLGGLAIATDRPLQIAVSGGLTARLGAIDVAPNAAITMRAGTVLRLEPGEGARGYVAAAGGFVVREVLGSASTDLRTGFGGVEGRALRSGDRLETGVASGVAGRWIGARPAGPIRVVPGPHPEGLEALLEDWVVGVEADRTGVRLDGPSLDGGEVPSMGLPLGAIQVPPDGRPIVMLADRPVTGGYRVPACVIAADVGRVAQLRTGDPLRFASVTADEAVEALRESERALRALEPLVEGDDAAWAGAHR